MFDNSLKYHIFKDLEIPFDEKGSTCGTVRFVQWCKEGVTPDESKAKLEIRKVYVNSGQEKTGKGYTFSTPEGPGELALGLISAGYGNTKDIIKAVRTRDDFIESVKTINDSDDGSEDGEMFDMRDLLLGMEYLSDEEE